MNIIKINYTELVKQYNRLVDHCNHINYIAGDILGRPYGRGEFKGVETEGARYEDEYNTSCHCHPEYTTDTYYIKPEWIEACEYDDEYGDYFDTELIKLLEAEKARIEQIKLDKELKAKEIMEEEKRKSKEARERVERLKYEELKQKFEDKS